MRRRRQETGTVLVEFLAVFPAFLVLSMFVLEIGFMWADRHVTRLAAFEAARVFTSANLPAWENGTAVTDPCQAVAVQRRAKQAAVRKIAIVAPPLGLFLSRLGATADGLDFSDINNSGIVGSMRRVAERWPTAAVSTELTCNYDSLLGRVDVDVKYHRMLQTPFINRIMFLLYRMSVFNEKNTGVKLGLDQNFMGIEANVVPPAAFLAAKEAMGSALGVVREHALPLNEAAALLESIPGVDKILANVPKVPVDLLPKLTAFEDQATNALAGHAVSGIDSQSSLLSSVVALIPSALWRIPITTHISLQRDSFTAAASGQGGPREPAWDGRLRGAINMEGKDGALFGTESASSLFRRWGHNMSNSHHDLQSGARSLNGN